MSSAISAVSWAMSGGCGPPRPPQQPRLGVCSLPQQRHERHMHLSTLGGILSQKARVSKRTRPPGTPKEMPLTVGCGVGRADGWSLHRPARRHYPLYDLTSYTHINWGWGVACSHRMRVGWNKKIRPAAFPGKFD